MSEDHSHALPKGHHIDEYEIVRVLGAGGFGITYLAFDHKLDGPVALKEYFPAGFAVRAGDRQVAASSTENREAFAWGLDRFIAEARAVHRFHHPNVVRVYRYVETLGTACIVMEYVEGTSLAAVLKDRGRLTPAQWRPWFEALLDGLEHVHAQGYLHRDIKPGNIVIRAKGGAPVLIDFGAARQATVEKTRHLTAVHTPGYAPIEQYSESSRQGPPTDIYGIAAVSYRALTGEPPPAAPDRMLEDRSRPLAQQLDDADRPWLDALDHGLAVRPEDRPQTIAAWRSALAPADAADQTDTAHSKKASNETMVLVATVAWLLLGVVIAVVIAGYVQRSSRDDGSALVRGSPDARTSDVTREERVAQVRALIQQLLADAGRDTSSETITEVIGVLAQSPHGRTVLQRIAAGEAQFPDWVPMAPEPSMLSDIGTALLSGAARVPQGIAGAIDTIFGPGMGIGNTIYHEFLGDPQAHNQQIREGFSPEVLRGQQEIAESTWGELPATLYRNPRAVAMTIPETLPIMGAIAASSIAAPYIGLSSRLAAAALTGGGITAGLSATDLRSDADGLTSQERLHAMATGVVTGLIMAGGGAVARRWARATRRSRSNRRRRRSRGAAPSGGSV